jgi:hypothetical protein
MSVFDGFTPTLTVSSNSVVNLDGYHSLKIENGAAVILDATKLAVVSLPQSGVFGYVIANFSNSRCSLSLSNHGLVGGSPTFLLSSFGKSGGAKPTRRIRRPGILASTTRKRWENLSAVFAVGGVPVMESESAVGTQAGGCPGGSAGQFERENARWHGDYSIAQHHEDGGDEAAKDRVWRDITVAHSGNRDDGPVHCRRNARKTVLLALDLIHHRANQDHHGQHREQEHGYFGKASAESQFQGGCFAEKLCEFENAEGTQKAKRTDQCERVSDAKEHSEVDGQDG